MQNVHKNNYLEPKIKILLVDMEQLICSSNMEIDIEPEIEDDEEKVANPYWNVL